MDGRVAPGYEGVRDAFEAAFGSRPRMGGALCVLRDGTPVVDLWAGWSDAGRRIAWQADTLSVMFSCTKGLISLIAALLVQAGRLDYDAPATAYWPGFGSRGGSGTLVRDLLAHRAGLPGLREDATLEELLDWDAMVGRLEQEPPLWSPGEHHAYHALTHGWLVGEVIRRVTGTTVGEALAEWVTRPLRVDAWLGLPGELEARVAHLHHGDGLQRFLEEYGAAAPAIDDWPDRAITFGGALPLGLVGESTGFNDKRLHAAELAGGGAVATARALATIWSATVVPTRGVRLLGDETIRRATAVVSEGEPYFSVPAPWARWGMGFQLDSDARPLLSASSFGHDGAGGQLAFADPDQRVGFAFLTNELETSEHDDRASRVLDALRDALGVEGAAMAEGARP